MKESSTANTQPLAKLRVIDRPVLESHNCYILSTPLKSAFFRVSKISQKEKGFSYQRAKRVNCESTEEIEPNMRVVFLTYHYLKEESGRSEYLSNEVNLHN